ncbi:MAG: NapC/NirT family cytochrome c [Acidobacteria bacterium]|nr:NapC/NirT family cytochrome c [Acidobacteriota bacterium]
MNQQPSQEAPGLFRNYLSWAGAALAIFSLGCISFLVLNDLWSKRPNPYIGIFAYVVFPVFMLFGLALIPLGMLLERRRRRSLATITILRYPRLDFNNARHRRIFGFFLGLSFILIPLSAVGSYQAFEVTESVGFCGQTCHTVMNPEFTAFQTSPHARVACVECHVGPGAPSYFKQKFAGVRRAYAALSNTYHRPIPSPLGQLRPASETCGDCHWSEKFFGSQLKTFTHYGDDEKNTPRQINMLIKVGGGSPTTGITAGIHWHMNIGNELTYAATDDKQQEIAYVRLKDMNGQVTEYYPKGSTLTPAQLTALPKRRMDCMDCHNRSAHTFNPPDRAVSDSMLAGKLDVSLPFLKQQVVEALVKPYATESEASQQIEATLSAYYRDKYPELFAQKQNAIKASIAEAQQIYRTNFFPQMKANWQSYPENIGHYYSAGCFRCHGGQFESRTGQVIRKDCSICHTVISQEEGKAQVMGGNGKDFVHPIELGDLKDTTCTDCHSKKGGAQ